MNEKTARALTFRSQMQAERWLANLLADIEAREEAGREAERDNYATLAAVKG